VPQIVRETERVTAELTGCATALEIGAELTRHALFARPAPIELIGCDVQTAPTELTGFGVQTDLSGQYDQVGVVRSY